MSLGYLAAPEAEEEATQKEFYDKEIGKSKDIIKDDDVEYKDYRIDEFEANEVDTE